MKLKLILLLLVVNLSACDFSEPAQTNRNFLNKEIVENKEAKINFSQKLIENQDLHTSDRTTLDSASYFISNEMYLDASNSSMYQKGKKLLVELSLEEPPEETTPIAALTTDEPIVIKEVRTVNENQEEYRNIFSNNFKISFLSKNKEKPLNINFSNNEYISTYPTYTDENISIIYVETKGISLRPEDYSWSSCLYLYHKESNKIIDFSPEGCVWQDIKRTAVTKKDDYERDEVYLDEVKVKNGIYTISFNNVPRLKNSQIDFSKEKTLTYSFKLNLKKNESQFQLVDCDYRYKKSNQLVKEHRECDYSLD